MNIEPSDTIAFGVFQGATDRLNPPPKSRCGIALAYLAGTYPSVSTTFILREIMEMRARGFSIQTASIDFPDWDGGGCGSAEADEVARTFYVKRRGAARILGDHAACFLRRPLRYLSGFGLALRLAGLDLHDVVLHLGYFAEAVVLGRWMERSGLAHLHVHFANASATVALLARSVYGFEYSIRIHGSDEFYGVAHYRLPQKVSGALFVCCIGWQCRSQVMKATLPDQWEKLEVCRLGVDPGLFRGREGATAQGAFEILCVARLVPAKGQSILLAAAGKLIERGRRIHVSLVGDGPGRAMFEALTARLQIAGHVTFHGSITQDRIREYLERADVFVLPSFAEGIPVTLMEAMAMEIPCISTLVGGIPELIQSGVNGILVPPSDPDVLAEAINNLMADPQLRARLGREGRRSVLLEYNLGRNSERLAAIFDRRLSPSKPD